MLINDNNSNELIFLFSIHFHNILHFFQYLSLLTKLSESLQISDLKGTVTLMHSSWLNVDELADARRQDHKKILQSLDKLKRSIRYLQETYHQEQRRSENLYI